MYPLPLPRCNHPLTGTERRTWSNLGLRSLTRHREGLTSPVVYGRREHLNQKTRAQGWLEKLLNGHNCSGGTAKAETVPYKPCMAITSFCGPAPESIPWLPLKPGTHSANLKCLGLSGTLLTATVFPSDHPVCRGWWQPLSIRFLSLDGWQETWMVHPACSVPGPPFPWQEDRRQRRLKCAILSAQHASVHTTQGLSLKCRIQRTPSSPPSLS